MKDTYLYPIIIELCEEGGYFAKCPTLQGIHAEGETYAEALENLESLIQLALEDDSNASHKAYQVAESLPAFQTMLPITR